jgi:hypothetical protein
MDLPNPEQLIKNPRDFVLPNRMDKVYVIGVSLMAVLRHNMTKERWDAVGVIIERIATSGNPDLAVTFAKDWLKDRPSGASPDKSLLQSLVPLLVEAKLI